MEAPILNPRKSVTRLVRVFCENIDQSANDTGFLHEVAQHQHPHQRGAHRGNEDGDNTRDQTGKVF